MSSLTALNAQILTEGSSTLSSLFWILVVGQSENIVQRDFFICTNELVGLLSRHHHSQGLMTWFVSDQHS